MSQHGIYTFYDCVPDGAIDIANVQPGDVLSRSWTFRVNNFGPANLVQNLVSQGNTRPNDRHPNYFIGDSGIALDPRNILRGYDGFLMNANGTRWYAQVGQWSAQINMTNQDYQAAGQKIVWALPVSYTVTLTLTETLILDELLLWELKRWLDGGGVDRDPSYDPVFAFQGRLTPPSNRDANGQPI